MSRVLRERFDSVAYLEAAAVGPGRRRGERIRRAGARLVGRRSLPALDRRELRRRCAAVERQLELTPVDAILAVAVDQLVAFLDTDIPVIHHSDTTFAAIENYYEGYTRLLPRSRRQGDEIARRAIGRATISIYPSSWAARSAVDVYGADPSTTFVVPYGANLEHPPAREEALDLTPRDRCRLLFVGREWDRKGGPIAMATLIELRRRGIDAELTVVGTEPDAAHEHLRVYPFLNKQIPEQLQLYNDLWRTSAFLFMPSRAETFGAIYCEAAANGLPSIATDTGGVGDAVTDGSSGRLLPLSAGADEYADVIEGIWRDREEYGRYVSGARRRFETDLNWDAWADRTASLVAGALLGEGGGDGCTPGH